MSDQPISYDEFVKTLFNTSGDLSKDFTHALLGIVTETHEYMNSTDAVNGLEELGDLEFYITAMRQVVERAVGRPLTIGDMDDEGIKAIFNPAEASGHVDLGVFANDLLDHAKRWIGYGKQPENLVNIFGAVCYFTTFVNLNGPHPNKDVDEIIAANRRKLSKRYEGLKFTQQAALNRDLDSERAALQAA